MAEDAHDLETAVVYQLPVEILAEIFVQSIPPLVPSEPYKLPEFEKHPRRIRAILALVCRLWRNVLNHEPRVWVTLALDYPNPNREIVSLWLMRSKSCPLDVYIDDNWRPFGDHPGDPLPDISKLLYNELPRIRSLFASDCFMQSLSTLPTICAGRTILPRMESLNLLNFNYCAAWKARFSFPRLRTLVLRDFELLIDGSMENVHHLDITEYAPRFRNKGRSIKTCWSHPLLQTVPNLVSLTWSINVSSKRVQQPVVLQFLRFLSLPSYGRYPTHTLHALECLVTPSLETLDLDLGLITSPPDHEVMLKKVLDVICRDGSVQLRHLTLRCSPKPEHCRVISPHLNHLDTFTIRDTQGRILFDSDSDSD